MRSLWETFEKPLSCKKPMRNLCKAAKAYEKPMRHLWENCVKVMILNKPIQQAVFDLFTHLLLNSFFAWNSRNAQCPVHHRVAWMHLDHQHRKSQAPPDSSKHHSIPQCQVFLPEVAKIQGDLAISAFHCDIAGSSTSRATCSHTLLGLRRSPEPVCRLAEDLQTMKVSIWSDMKSNEVMKSQEIAWSDQAETGPEKRLLAQSMQIDRPC